MTHSNDFQAESSAEGGRDDAASFRAVVRRRANDALVVGVHVLAFMLGWWSWSS